MPLFEFSIYLCCFTPEILKNEGALYGYNYSFPEITREEVLQQLKEFVPNIEEYTSKVKLELDSLPASERNELYKELHSIIYATTKSFDLPGTRGYVRYRFQELFGKKEDFSKDF
jgi:hypothetical protein